MNARDTAVVRAAALLHDLLTGPFGHSFQYVMEDNPFEQRFEHANIANGVSAQFLKLARAGSHFAGRQFEVAQLLGDLAADVFTAVEGEGPFGPIIAGTLDLDNLDNVVRLAFHMGLCDDEDRALPLKLTPILEIRNNHIAARGQARMLFQRWFDIRRRLYEFLLLDRGEFAAKAMLTMAVELAARANLLGPDDWTLTDDELLDELKDRSVGDHQAIGQMVRRLRVGDLFECVNIWRSDAVDLYHLISRSEAKRALEREIEESLSSKGAPKVNICIHYILDNKKTCRSLEYIDLDDGEMKTVGFNSRSLLVGAFITNSRSSSLAAKARERVANVVRQQLTKSGLGGLVPAEEPLQDAVDFGGLFA